MHRYLLIAVTVAAVVTFGACGSTGTSSSKSPSAPQGQSPTVTYQPAGANPSNSAKMVCEPAVRSEIAATLGIHETRVTTPTWVDHVYSCTYVYPRGSIVISVKELVNADTTTAYFNGLAQRFGKQQNLNGLAQDAFIAKNADVVVRKDYKVLLVDVQGISQTFLPAMTRADVATNVAAAIMSCWAGA
jgi:hypothetical protein